MAAIIFKAILLYFFYIVARGIYRTYKSVKAVQGAAENIQKEETFKSKSKEEVIEAEFRHLD